MLYGERTGHIQCMRFRPHRDKSDVPGIRIWGFLIRAFVSKGSCLNWQIRQRLDASTHPDCSLGIGQVFDYVNARDQIKRDSMFIGLLLRVKGGTSLRSLPAWPRTVLFGVPQEIMVGSLVNRDYCVIPCLMQVFSAILLVASTFQDRNSGRVTPFSYCGSVMVGMTIYVGLYFYQEMGLLAILEFHF